MSSSVDFDFLVVVCDAFLTVGVVNAELNGEAVFAGEVNFVDFFGGVEDPVGERNLAEEVFESLHVEGTDGGDDGAGGVIVAAEHPGSGFVDGVAAVAFVGERAVGFGCNVCFAHFVVDLNVVVGSDVVVAGESFLVGNGGVEPGVGLVG